MKKSYVFILSFIIIFFLLIGFSSFSWAYSEPYVEITLNDWVISIDNSDSFLNDYNYFYTSYQGNSYCLFISTEPIYKSSSQFGDWTSFISNGNVAKSVNFNGNVNLSSESFTYNLQSLDAFIRGGGDSSGIKTSQASIFTDDTMTELYRSGDYVKSDFFVAKDMGSIVSNLSLFFLPDLMFIQNQSVIILVVLAVTFSLGFMIVRRLLKRTSKGIF